MHARDKIEETARLHAPDGCDVNFELFDFKRRIEFSITFPDRTECMIEIQLPTSFGYYEYHEVYYPIGPILDQIKQKFIERFGEKKD